MVRIFCIASLALAAVSAVSGHVIRHRRKAPPSGWEKDILQDYDGYHGRYLDWKCQDQHNTTFFDKCCHPLLKGESIDVLTKLGCQAPVDDCDGESSVPPSYTPSPSQPTHTTPASEVLPSSSSSPAPSVEKIQKNKPAPSPVPTEPASTTAATTTKETTSTPPPAQTPSNNNDFTGGQATFFYQNGVAGACGKVHSDDDLICAMDSIRYGDAGNKSPLCGKQVVITNTKNGKTVTVTVADDCPTCENENSIDLSRGAFEALGPLSDGVEPISWHFAS